MTDVGPEALDLLKVKEAARRMSLSERQVWRLIDAERKRPGTGLESVRIGTAVRIVPEAVTAYVDRLTAEARKGNAA